MEPWRYSPRGLSIALRVTPRGGRDGIDGIETLADGRPVVRFAYAPTPKAAKPIAPWWRCWRRRSGYEKSMSGYVQGRRRG
jgi:hypothetical protein